jgi:hypothetical protein
VLQPITAIQFVEERHNNEEKEQQENDTVAA